MSPIDRLWNYWNIQKPVRLVHQPNFDGVSITPEHTTKQVLETQEVDEEIIVITPIHNVGSITRCFGDILADELN